MTFDLHGALMRKQEYECARLDAFEFRHRALTVRLMAERLRADGHDVPDPDAAARAMVDVGEDAVLGQLYARVQDRMPRVRYRALCAQARQTASERLKRIWGDPTPHALA
jgi:hypothetical protein